MKCFNPLTSDYDTYNDFSILCLLRRKRRVRSCRVPKDLLTGEYGDYYEVPR